MDWLAEAERIKSEQALDHEVVAAFVHAPTQALPSVIEATAAIVESGTLILTPWDWQPVMARLRKEGVEWPGPRCQQCGSPLGGEGSNNNYEPGLCWFCLEN